MELIAGVSGKMDVVFAVDSSRRVDPEMFNKMKELVKASLASYNISESEARIGLVGFGDKAEISKKPADGASGSELEQSVIELKRIGGARRMNKAMRKMQAEIFNDAMNSKRKAKQVLVLFTTGKNSGDGSGSLPSTARSLRQQGVDIIVVSIGKEKDLNELQAIAGKLKNVIDIPSFEMLPNAIGVLEGKVQETTGDSFFAILICFYASI